MKRKEITDERIERVFFELLPHYWKTPDELPAQIRLILALNRWGVASFKRARILLCI